MRKKFELELEKLAKGLHKPRCTKKRDKVRERGINESWQSLRDILEVQRRVAITFKQEDGQTMHVRKSTVPEERLRKIYEALSLGMNPGWVKKLTVAQESRNVVTLG